MDPSLEWFLKCCPVSYRHYCPSLQVAIYLLEVPTTSVVRRVSEDWEGGWGKVEEEEAEEEEEKGNAWGDGCFWK